MKLDKNELFGTRNVEYDDSGNKSSSRNTTSNRGNIQEGRLPPAFFLMSRFVKDTFLKDEAFLFPNKLFLHHIFKQLRP